MTGPAPVVEPARMYLRRLAQRMPKSTQSKSLAMGLYRDQRTSALWIPLISLQESSHRFFKTGVAAPCTLTCKVVTRSATLSRAASEIDLHQAITPLTTLVEVMDGAPNMRVGKSQQKSLIR